VSACLDHVHVNDGNVSSPLTTVRRDLCGAV